MAYFFLSVARTLELLLQLLIICVATFVLIPEHMFVHSFSYSSGWTLINRVDNMQRHCYLQMGTKWTLDRVRDVSFGVTSRSELRRKSQGAYQAASRNDCWAELSSALQVSPRIRQHYWTQERTNLEAAKYTNRTAFYNGSRSAYNAAKAKHTLDQIFAHMKADRRRKLTFERVREEALKYGSRSEFKNGSGGAYMAANRNGWLDDVCDHMTPLRHPSGYWTIGQVEGKASKYISRSEFRRGRSGAYEAAQRNGWLDDVCSHMGAQEWTQERTNVEAAKYTNRTTFSKGSPSAYRAARVNKTLDQVCAHMKTDKRRKWNIERVSEEALKYRRRKEFEKRSNGAYQAAWGHNWLDVVCSHMEAPRRKQSGWTLELASEDAAKYTNRTAFSKGSPSAYRAARVNKTLDHVCSHMKADRRRKLTFERVREEAWKYGSRSELFKNGSAGAYMAAQRNGWLDDVCSHMGAQEWTQERTNVEAAKYTNRTTFSKGSPSAYRAARVNKTLDQVCAHMKTDKRRKWNIERVSEEALKYRRRKEFEKRSNGAYQAAWGHNWLDVVCSHMEAPRRKQSGWTLDLASEDAAKYTNRTAFSKGSPSAYRAARVNKTLDHVCSHMKADRRRKLTFERVREEAWKYGSRSELFKNGSAGAYMAAQRNGWLDDVCGHMGAQEWTQDCF